jgi:hypothetical protein
VAVLLRAEKIQIFATILVAGLIGILFRYRALPKWKQLLPKETVASLLFALGAAVASHAWLADAHALLCGATLTAAGLFVLNIITIAQAELSHGQADASAREICTRWSGQACWILSVAIVFYQFQVAHSVGYMGSSFSFICIACSCLLTWLRLQSAKISPETVRSLADLILIAPVLI